MVKSFMNQYDKSKTGTLNRAEVIAMATDLCSGMVGGITDADVEFIMRAGGENTADELHAEDLPTALAVLMAVRDDCANFHELFLRHDADKTGVLPLDQLSALLSEVNDGLPPAPSDVSYILNQCEPRGTHDPIPETQLRCAIACWYCLKEPAHEKIKAMFQAWDTGKTGVISKAELAAVMKNLSPEVTDKEVNTLFTSIDTHQTGSIEYDEFLEWVLGGGIPLGTGMQEPKPAPGKPPKIKWSTGWLS